MDAEILRPCNGCGGTLVSLGRKDMGHHWIHRNPNDENYCPHVFTGKIARLSPDPSIMEEHPAVVSKQLADVINVDFANKKRVD